MEKELKSFQKLVDTLEKGFTRVGNELLVLSGAVIIIMIMWAGLQYIQGNAEAGKKTLVAAVIGAIIVALATIIISLVKQLGGFTG